LVVPEADSVGSVGATLVVTGACVEADVGVETGAGVEAEVGVGITAGVETGADDDVVAELGSGADVGVDVAVDDDDCSGDVTGARGAVRTGGCRICGKSCGRS
jgi:hypothetical protein